MLTHFSKLIIQTIVDTKMDFLSDDQLHHNNSTTSTLLIVLALLLLDEENQAIVENINAQNFQSLLYCQALAGTIRRQSLQDPTRSIFWEVYKAGQDESLIQLCGFHKAGFDNLVRLFQPIYHCYTPHGTTIRIVKKRARRQ